MTRMTPNGKGKEIQCQSSGRDEREVRKKEKNKGRRTSHEVVVLGHLFGGLSPLDVGEESHEDVLREGSDVRLREAGKVGSEVSACKTRRNDPTGVDPAEQGRETDRAWPLTLMKRTLSIVVAAYE